MASKKPRIGGRIGQLQAKRLPQPGPGEVKRYIFTSLQNNTKAWPGFNNLVALAEHYGAKLMVGTFTYNKATHGNKSVKRGTGSPADFSEVWYDPEVEQYLQDDPLQVAPGLVWCGSLNILPTAKDPLLGLETYYERQSLIVPHAKQAMRSVVSGKGEGTKMTYSTGVISKRNYIQKRTGQIAEQLHCYGGLIVEVTNKGWFVRQLQADEDDCIYDLNLRAQAGKVTERTDTVEAITWGDVHEISLAKDIRKLCWGAGGILDTLRPTEQHLHDLLDFRSRNHHDMKNPHKLYALHVQKKEGVRDEVHSAWKFLTQEAWRPWCRTVVVPSNHDEAMTRWLREADYRLDPVNAEFFLERQLAKYRAIARGDDRFLDLEDAMVGMGRPDALFLRRDDEHVICKTKRQAGVECGLHGDTFANLTRYGRPLNIGHRHSAGIYDHLYVAGIMGSLDQTYNVGPSSWSHSLIITYRNGKRAIVTVWKGAWRA